MNGQWTADAMPRLLCIKPMYSQTETAQITVTIMLTQRYDLKFLGSRESNFKICLNNNRSCFMVLLSLNIATLAVYLFLLT